MSDNTEILGLFKYDTNVDKKKTFNINKALNENWAKIDERFGVQTITLPVDGWAGVEAPYSQTINVAGISANHNPHVALKTSSDYVTALNELKEYSKIFKGETGAGTITFFANKQIKINISLNLKIL